MSDIQRADPGARRQAVLLLVVSRCVGALVILGFEQYSVTIRDWVLSDAEPSSRRLTFVLRVSTVALSMPLLAIAAYFWTLGSRVVRAQQFPPPAQRVIRDTPIVQGQMAVARGRVLKAVAVGFAILAGALSLIFWRLAIMLSERVP